MSQQQSELLGWLDRSPIRLELPEPVTLRRSYPLLDKQVLEFCLALSGGYKIRDGYSRYPIRKALDGLLPPRIQWRTGKTAFSPDYYARYNRQRPLALKFVAGIGNRDPIRQIVDVDALSRLLQQPSLPDKGMIALSTIPATIYLICFLRQFSDFRP
jgi:hypothetical protein